MSGASTKNSENTFGVRLTDLDSKYKTGIIYHYSGKHKASDYLKALQKLLPDTLAIMTPGQEEVAGLCASDSDSDSFRLKVTIISGAGTKLSFTVRRPGSKATERAREEYRRALQALAPPPVQVKVAIS